MREPDRHAGARRARTRACRAARRRRSRRRTRACRAAAAPPTRPRRRRRRARRAASGCASKAMRGTVTSRAARGYASCSDGPLDRAALHRARPRAGRQPDRLLARRARSSSRSSTSTSASSRIGREHIPQDGPGDLRRQPPLVPGPVRDRHARAAADLLRGQEGAVPQPRSSAWFLNALGAFPVDRGAGDQDMIDTAKAILDRGDARPDLPRGHAHPPRLARPPQARRRPARARDRRARSSRSPSSAPRPSASGWRIRPHKVRIRVGRPLTLPAASSEPSPQLAAAVTDRIWPCVMLQWEWLGGLPPLRRAAVVGAGSWGTSLAVDARPRRPRGRARLPHRRAGRALRAPRAATSATCPASSCPTASASMRAADLELRRHDLVCFAVPAPRAARRGRRARRARSRRAPACSSCSKGLVPPLGTLPSAYVAERVRARAVGLARRPGARRRRARARRLARASPRPTRPSPRQLADALARRRLRRRDAPPTWPASSSPAAPRTPPRSPPPPPARRRPERRRRRRRQGVRRGRRVRAPRTAARPETFAGLAGAGDLVATVLAERQPQPPRRRAARRRACPPRDIGPALGQAAEAVDTVPLLADAHARRRRRRAGPRRARRR